MDASFGYTPRRHVTVLFQRKTSLIDSLGHPRLWRGTKLAKLIMVSSEV